MEEEKDRDPIVSLKYKNIDSYIGFEDWVCKNIKDISEYPYMDRLTILSILLKKVDKLARRSRDLNGSEERGVFLERLNSTRDRIKKLKEGGQSEDE